MSEAELHVLQARLRGGILSKAGRGELRLPLPVGFCYAAGDRVVLDPDLQVQQAVHLFFATFARTGSAWTTLKVFRAQDLAFPRRIRTGTRKGELLWAPLLHSTALHLLHNPRYAGAFFFGRTHTRKLADGHVQSRLLPQEQWHTLVRDAHPGYITWAEFEENQRRLQENAQLCGLDRRHGPPREGPALLQGIVLCGRCGERMTVRYHHRGTALVPEYLCQRDGIEQGGRLCQVVPGGRLDHAIGDLLVTAMTPLAVETALAVQAEITTHIEDTDRLRLLQVERARYEADLAQRRFRQVDPENRLVAAVLEAEWNASLRLLEEAQRTSDQQRQADRQRLDDEQRAAILALTTDFPRLWHDPHTPARERKRMVRFLLSDVTLCKDEQIIAHVRFAVGATRTLLVPLGPIAEEQRRTDPAILAEIDHLLDHYTDAGVAALLNERGMRSFTGNHFTGLRIASLRQNYHLANRFSRLRAAGMLTRQEVATALGICPATVQEWRHAGLLRAHPADDRGTYLYEPLGTCPPQRYLARYAARKTLRAQQQTGAV